MSLHIGFYKGTRDEYTLRANDLKTHGMCVGMTGSGKTGLCIALLEELALQGVPLLLIDPKGDLGNIMLPPTKAQEFAILISPEQAQAAGMTHSDYVHKVTSEYSLAREQDGVSKEDLMKLARHVLYRIYTPGGGPGMGLSIVSALKRPKDISPQHAEIVADSLLTLVKKSEQTQAARALVGSLLLQAWYNGKDATMPSMVDAIIDPPMPALGGLDMETFYPRKRRIKLAQEFNAILASPGWEAWLSGHPLDLESLLWDNGNPTVTVINIAHLTDVQRHFFVSLLFSQALQWMRSQSGSENLRALIYMDEVAGYFPPNANPPAKRAAMMLAKQGRAFGLGLMFSSQNPVDLDYKLLGNMGVWMVGKLNTERDKARLEAGLEGELKVPALGKREFLVRNIHGKTAVIRSRCCASYLFGPLSQDMIRALSQAMYGEEECKGEAHKQRLESLQVAIDKQQQVVDMLQREVKHAMGASFLTVAVSLLFGRRATAMRQLTRQPPKKAQALLEARARLEALQTEYRSVYELLERSESVAQAP